LNEENFDLLRELFVLGPEKMRNFGLNTLIKKFLLHSEIAKKYIERLEIKHQNLQKSCKEKEVALEDLRNENEKLRDVK